MSLVSIVIDAPPSAVWAVLEDPYAYPKWVVGTDRTLSADPAWPTPGSHFRVHVALGLVDRTTSRAVQLETRIVLDAGSRYLGPAKVTVELEPAGDGTKVSITENPAGKVAVLRHLPPVQWALKRRNEVAMQRLRKLVLQRAAVTANAVA